MGDPLLLAVLLAVPLGCSFAAVGHAPLPTMPASYVSAGEVRCVSPPVDGPADAGLHLVAIHGGGASAGLPFTFYDAVAPPEISHLAPRGAPVGAHAPTVVQIDGSNFAPLGHACEFGGQVTAATSTSANRSSPSPSTRASRSMRATGCPHSTSKMRSDEIR